MKSIVYSIVALMMCVSAYADNKVALYVDDVPASGDAKELTIPVKMRNTVDVIGVAFHVSLPEDMTLIQDDIISSATIASRLPLGDGTQISVVDVVSKNNSTQVAAYGRNVFSGSDGNIVVLKVNVSDKVADGDYEVKFDAISFSEKGNISHGQDAFTVSVTVGTPTVSGDVNDDGIVNMIDVVKVLEYVKSGVYDKKADANNDGVINMIDVVKILEIIKQ